MYKLDDDSVRLTQDVWVRRRSPPPPFCTGGGGLWSTVDDYLKFARMLLKAAKSTACGCSREDSVGLMRTDRLTDEQKRDPFLGMPFWIGRGFGLGLSVVTDPEQITAAVRPRRAGHVRLAGRIRHLVAGRPVGEPDPDLSDSEPSRFGRRRRARGSGQYVVGQTAERPTEIRPPHLSGARALDHRRAGRNGDDRKGVAAEVRHIHPDAVDAHLHI